MSALTRFQPKFTPGNLRYRIDDTKVVDGYLECDGSTVLKNAYPDLFNVVGYTRDNQTLSGTASTSGTLDIEDVIYANGIYVYVGENATIQTSNDAVTWTSRNVDTPTFVGGKTFSRVGTTSTTNVSLTDLTGGAASSPSANDIVFVAVATGSNANRSQAVDGYNQISTSYINSLGTDTNLWTGYKIMGATPDTTITVPSSGSIDDAQTVAIHVWRNLSEYDLSDTTGTGAGTGSSVLPNPAAITTVSNNTVLLVIAAGGHSRGTFTYTASYLNNFVSVGANDTFDSTIGMGSVTLTTAQTYDPATWTFGSTDSSLFSNASITIALRPKRLHSVAYGNNIFVAVGNGGFLETSPNAITWTRRESGTTNTINEVIFANNTFVYVGNTGTLATSTNGTDWTPRSSGTTQNIKSITYANNSFVYITDTSGSASIGTSSDAITWTNQKINELTYVGGTHGGRAGSTSTTEVSLTSLTGGTSSAPAEGDIVFIGVAIGTLANTSQAVSGYTQIASLYANDSFDTNLWVGYKVMGSTPDTSVTLPSSGSVDNAQTYAIQVWKGVDSSIFDATATTSILTNTILVNPSAITTVSSNTVLLVVGAGAHNQGIQTFLQPGETIPVLNFLSSGADDVNDSTIGFASYFAQTAGVYDPVAWNFSTSNQSAFSNASVTIALKPLLISSVNNIVNANNRYLVCGNSGFIATSTDTLNWTVRTSGTSNNINDVTFSNIDNEFAYVAADGEVRTSSNGVTWTAATSGITNSLNAIIYEDGYTYVGDGGAYASASYYNYNPQIEFKLPSSDVYNIFVDNDRKTFMRAYIKYE